MPRTAVRPTARRAPVLAAALLALPLASAAAQGDDFRWSGRLAADKTIEIRNINGDVRAEPASGGEVEVLAVKTEGRRGDAEDVKIEVVQHDDGVTICAVYPSSRGRRTNTCEAGGGHQSVDNNDTEVAFTVRVPSNVRLSANSVNGSVRAENMAADVDANTVNGAVSVTSRGLVEASSVNGDVDVRMGRADWTGALKLSTVNGGLSVTLPASAAAEVRASSVNGDMDSDFPMTVKGKWGPRRMTGTIGNGGGRSLVLETVNGTIELRRAS